MTVLPRFAFISLLIIKDILTFKHKRKKCRPGEMTQWVKALATETDNLSLIPEEPTWQKERTGSCGLSSDLHEHAVAPVFPL